MLRVVGGLDRPRRDRRAAIVIPARFSSVRFPGKPLSSVRGVGGQVKTLVERSWEAACAVSSVTEIWIATDDLRIADAAIAFGANVVLTDPACRNGTERCWDAVATAGIDAEVVINFQGDAPLTPPLAVEAIIAAMHADPSLPVVTPMVRCSALLHDRLKDEARHGRVGGTTVVFDHARNALYFSKRVIPHVPDRMVDAPIYLHVGLYGYRRQALADYAALPPPLIEGVEGLEQLRFLHAGIPVRMIEVADPPGGLWEVNNPADIVTVERALSERRLG